MKRVFGVALPPPQDEDDAETRQARRDVDDRAAGEVERLESADLLAAAEEADGVLARFLISLGDLLLLLR